MNEFPILSLLTFLPVLGMVIILFMPGKMVKEIKITSLVITFLQIVLAFILLGNFDYSAGGIYEASSFQFIEKWRWIEITGLSWIGTIKVDYFLGADGISVPMILLTAIVSFIASISSWNISKSVKGYFALFLLLDTGMMGVFVSLDFFLFYVFLGIDASANVLLNWNLGWTKKRICCN